MSAIYFPVTKFEKYKEHRYWEHDNPYIAYDKILVSPFTTGWEFKDKDFKNPKLTIYADSGGFQIAIKKQKGELLKVDLISVLRWQERIAKIAFTLDIPPHSYGKDYTHNQFLKCMRKSNFNARIMVKKKLNDDMQLWAVIQGKNYKECELWYNDLENREQYDGYCIALSVHKSNLTVPWVEQLDFARTISKRFHFLGSSDKIFTLVLAKFSRIMKLDYSYDTSSSNIGERLGKYIGPISFEQIPFSQEKKPLDSLSCSCPICSKYTIAKLRVRSYSPFINMHNLIVYLDYNKYANRVAENDEYFLVVLDNLLANRFKGKSDFYKNRILALLYDEDIPNKLEDKQVPPWVKKYLF